jgi:hypothetical protein
MNVIFIFTFTLIACSPPFVVQFRTDAFGDVDAGSSLGISRGKQGQI